MACDSEAVIGIRNDSIANQKRHLEINILLDTNSQHSGQDPVKGRTKKTPTEIQLIGRPLGVENDVNWT